MPATALSREQTTRPLPRSCTVYPHVKDEVAVRCAAVARERRSASNVSRQQGNEGAHPMYQGSKPHPKSRFVWVPTPCAMVLKRGSRASSHPLDVLWPGKISGISFGTLPWKPGRMPSMPSNRSRSMIFTLSACWDLIQKSGSGPPTPNVPWPLDHHGKLQSAPTHPVGSQHSRQPTVKLHILPLGWIFPLGKG